MVVLVILFGGSQSAKPLATPTPSASVSPTPSADEQLLSRLSERLAVKFFTFSRADDPAYFASIKTYLSTTFYNDTVSSNRQFADKAPFLVPQQSVISGDPVVLIKRDDATVEVPLTTTETKSGEKYDQVVVIKWHRFGTRWSATNVYPASSEKGD